MKGVLFICIYFSLAYVLHARIVYGGKTKEKARLNPSTTKDNAAKNWETELERQRQNKNPPPLESPRERQNKIPPAPHDDLSAQMAQVLVAMESMSQQMTGLRQQLTNMKYQNNIVYRQLKRLQHRCVASSSQSTGIAAKGKLMRTGMVNPKANEIVDELVDSLEEGPPAAAARCPNDFAWNRGTKKCYKFANDRITWRMASEKCQAMDASLVAIETAKEQKYITDMARATAELKHCDFWTGGHVEDRSSGQWVWKSSGQPLSFTNWNHNEPNNGNGDEHCQQMLWVFNWRWNDAACTYGSSCYICETKPW